jgi:hypothetical protein
MPQSDPPAGWPALPTLGQCRVDAAAEQGHRMGETPILQSRDTRPVGKTVHKLVMAWNSDSVSSSVT